MTREPAKVRITLEWAEHLVVQLRDAAKETGWESLLRDAEDLRETIDMQYPNQGPASNQ